MRRGVEPSLRVIEFEQALRSGPSAGQPVRYDRDFVRLGFRDIASDTNERTLIFGLLLQNVGVGNTINISIPKT